MTIPIQIRRKYGIRPDTEVEFLAGRAFRMYRQRGGLRRAPMPDFYIGAHAAVTGFTLVTRDARRYLEYFPRLEIIAP